MAVLEDLISKNALQNKTICYYPGSFDPPHKGHEYIARETVRRGFCDFTLIFAIWGDDVFKKRTPTKIRIETLFSLFKDDPNVIVTKLNPFQLQNALTEPTKRSENNRLFVTPKNDVGFVGLIGSDMARFYADHEEYLREFMIGEKLTEKDDRDEVSRGDVCLPAKAFIVADRKGFSFSPKEMPDGRKILGRLDTGDNYPISSAEIRKTLADNEDASSVLSESVVEIIKKYNLYV
ncbi:MAG: hypothetical protein LBL99_00175 [Holosporaceae bacterium]|jgi:nicotinic acid mononucleotide adenylyltransferase|nr:hypothetical protein [Holosporaceae bacterium]